MDVDEIKERIIQMYERAEFTYRENKKDGSPPESLAYDSGRYHAFKQVLEELEEENSYQRQIRIEDEHQKDSGD